jgi:hypothetical protein
MNKKIAVPATLARMRAETATLQRTQSQIRAHGHKIGVFFPPVR